MRTTDDPWPAPLPPLGERVVKPEPRRPEWVQVPDAPKGVERNVRTGQLRTDGTLPK
jgi:hypothetical protein